MSTWSSVTTVPPNAGQYRPFGPVRRGAPIDLRVRRPAPSDGLCVRWRRIGCRGRARIKPVHGVADIKGAPANKGSTHCAHSHFSDSADCRARRADRGHRRRRSPRAQRRCRRTRRGPATTNGWDRSVVADDRRRQRRRPERHRHRPPGRTAARHQRRQRPRPSGLAAADGHRDRQHAGGRRPLQQRPQGRSSSASARPGFRTSRAASRSTTANGVVALHVPHAGLLQHLEQQPAPRRLRRRRVLVARDRRRQRRRLSPTSSSAGSTCTCTRSTATATRS